MIKDGSNTDKDNMENNNNELITGSCNGDRVYQRKFFNKYKNHIHSLVYLMLGNNFDIDDVIQQVFIQIYKSLYNYQGLSSLDTWIYRITSKVCIDQLRKKYRKRQVNVIKTGIDIEAHQDLQEMNPSIENEHTELKEQVQKGLNSLSEDKRLVLILFEIEGFSLQEISDIIRKPLGTVKSRLFHGRKELAKYLKEYIS